MKKCCKCGKFKPLKAFGKCRPARPGGYADGKTYDCKECHNEARRKWSKANRAACNKITKKYYKANPEFKLWVGAKARAKKLNKPFTIKREDIKIPVVCPVLGIPLKFSKHHAKNNSPSLDCVVPELGYVFGNIAVISHKANTMKSNASLEELRKLVEWLEKRN